jgi:hypothetical protein
MAPTKEKVHEYKLEASKTTDAELTMFYSSRWEEQLTTYILSDTMWWKNYKWSACFKHKL